jgi:hypothetical protein
MTMPLLDHFNPPLGERRSSGSFLGHWACCLCDPLNHGGLPLSHFADPMIKRGGRVRPDDELGVDSRQGQALEFEAFFPDQVELQVMHQSGGLTLVGVICFVTSRNKALSEARRALAIRCASLLQAGVGLLLVDVVTNCAANIHDEMSNLLGAPATFPGSPTIYASAYRPFREGDDCMIAVWQSQLAIGEPLPVMPLWPRDAEAPVRVDLEAPYTEARRRSAIP